MKYEFCRDVYPVLAFEAITTFEINPSTHKKMRGKLVSTIKLSKHVTP